DARQNGEREAAARVRPAAEAIDEQRGDQRAGGGDRGGAQRRGVPLAGEPAEVVDGVERRGERDAAEQRGAERDAFGHAASLACRPCAHIGRASGPRSLSRARFLKRDCPHLDKRGQSLFNFAEMAYRRDAVTWAAFGALFAFGFLNSVL